MNTGNIIRIAGAYVAWVMGSGFATGPEILECFTSYGYHSFVLLGINLIGFLLIGPAILQAGREHAGEADYDHFVWFCGKRLGTFYSWFLPVSMFAGMVILISGAGATLQEYYGLNHYVGALLMAAMALTAYIIGFQRFVRIVSFIGPAIIAFSLLVGIVTVCRDFDGLAQVADAAAATDPAAASANPDAARIASAMEAKQPVPWWWLSGLLYISYNLCGGSKYYTALGMTAASSREALWGAAVGTIALMASILLMNTAMLTDIGHTAVLDVPTLFLARKIAYALGAVFSIILIMGIFSSCSAMLWTISEKFVDQGSRKSYLFAGCTSLCAFLLGLLPFAGLVGVVYTILGYIGLVFAACVIWRRIKW
ncbi:MAG: hypothetical protein IJ128_02680 [Firmicutes bacterium]|nr:hypothetical protein [Bacillota bacterium]